MSLCVSRIGEKNRAEKQSQFQPLLYTYTSMTQRPRRTLKQVALIGIMQIYTVRITKIKFQNTKGIIVTASLHYFKRYAFFVFLPVNLARINCVTFFIH